MKDYSTRTMHVHAQEFNSIIWKDNPDFYKPLPIYSNANGEPLITTLNGEHILANEEFILLLANKQYLVLSKELFNFIYKPLFPYN